MKLSEKCFDLIFQAMVGIYYGTAGEPLSRHVKPWVAVNEMALKFGLTRVDGGFLVGQGDQDKVFDGYAEVIMQEPAEYAGVEVRAMRSTGDAGREFLQECDREAADTWEVIALLDQGGGSEVIGRFICEELATEYAAMVVNEFFTAVEV